MERRRLAWALIATTVVVIPSLFWATLHVLYKIGILAGVDTSVSALWLGHESFNAREI